MEQFKIFYIFNINFNLILKEKSKEKIRALLYMSLYQLIYLDKIPEYAIINEAVKIAKKKVIKQVNL